MNSGIELKNITMDFGKVTALKDVSVRFAPGKIYGLLGRNGAGKSTMLSLIANRLFPTAGEILVDGQPAQDNNAVQGRIYYMGEKNIFPDNTTVKMLFRWTKDFYPGFDTAYANELAERFNLNTKKLLKKLSTGYLTIAKLIAALATGAEYIFFDEPVLGLDANHREMFYRELLSRYNENPQTIILSTHLIEEISDIVERVVIIKEGAVLIDEETAIVKQMGYMISGKAGEVDEFARGKEIISEDVFGGLKSVCILGTAQQVPESLEISPLDLQKLFVRLTNDEGGK